MSTSRDSNESANRLLLVSLLQADRVPEEEVMRLAPTYLKNLKAMSLVVPQWLSYLCVWSTGFESHVIAAGALYFQAMQTTTKEMKMILCLAADATAICDNCPYLEAASVVATAKICVPEPKLAALVTKSYDALTIKERLMVEVVTALCAKPRPTLTKDQKNTLVQSFGAKHAEWIASAAATFGYLSKFMDAVVAEMDQLVADIAFGSIAKYGWTPGAHGWMLDPTSEPKPLPKPDGLLAQLKVLRYVPGTISYVNGLQKGVPAKWSKLQPFLKARTGHDFPFMAKIQTAHMRKGLGAMLVHNLDPRNSVSGLAVKCLIGMMFATFVRSDALEAAVRDMSNKFGVSAADLETVRSYALDDEIACYKFSNKQVRAMLVLGKAILPTPSKVTPQVVEHLRDVDVAASVIVELVLWMSLLTTLHRMSFYHLL